MVDPEAARRELLAARQAREDAEPRWRRAILGALEAGVGAAEVARLAGCTRQRVYQIKDDALSNRFDKRVADK
jgi:DNA-binding phage protein